MSKFTYFWKPHEKNGYLSNWYSSIFEKDGIKFMNSEQYFMWKKQQLFDKNNTDLESKILHTGNPKVIKDLGRKVNNFDEYIWNINKYNIMCEALMEKFKQNMDLKRLLLETDDEILVEASPYDRIWGIGLNETNARKGLVWRGENLLGKALMDVRNQLKH